MGTLRYCLAMLVLLSHFGITIGNVNPGVVSVVIFYILSGYVVAGLLSRLREKRHSIRHFYIDRAWRILPQYVYVLCFSMIVWLIGAESPFLVRANPGLAEWAANLSIIPLAYYMYTGLEGFVLIPPAWSLGVELQFYLILPLLVAFNSKSGMTTVGMAFFIGSVIINALAQVQWLHSDYFAYRLLPGVLFVFLLGVCLRHHTLRSLRIIVLLWVASLTCVILHLICKNYTPYGLEVVLGITIGLPILVVCARLNKKSYYVNSRAYRVDGLLGSLSYGVFLVHFPVMWLLKIQPGASWEEIFLVALVSSALAWLGHTYVEQPLWRRFREMNDGRIL